MEFPAVLIVSSEEFVFYEKSLGARFGRPFYQGSL